MSFDLAITSGATMKLWQAYRGELDGEIEGTDIPFEGNKPVQTDPLSEDPEELYGSAFEHYENKAGRAGAHGVPLMYHRTEERTEFLYRVEGPSIRRRIENTSAYFSSDRDDPFEHAKEVRDEVLAHWKRGDDWAYKAEDEQASNLLTAQKVYPQDLQADMINQLWTIPESEYNNALGILRKEIKEGSLDSAAIVSKRNKIPNFEDYETVIYVDNDQPDPTSCPLSEAIDNIREDQLEEQERRRQKNRTSIDRVKDLLS